MLHVFCKGSRMALSTERQVAMGCKGGKGIFMHVCAWVCCNHFTLGPLNPKPITKDLSSYLPKASYWTLNKHVQRASCLRLIYPSVISGGLLLI